MARAASIDEILAKLPTAQRALTERLRQLIAGAAPACTEHVKWNAPSFCVEGEDRVTLNLSPRGAVRIVLHRGAKPKGAGFTFEDPAGLAAWPAPDRGVVTLHDDADLDRKAEKLTALIGRWITATS